VRTPRLSLRHALALGLLQGPTELLPVSSSAHTALLPRLAGWPYPALHASSRKSFDVALHAGAGLALTIAMRDQLLADARALDARRALALALALAPPALAGYQLRRPIERRLGGPRSVAAGLVAGAIALAAADVAPATRAQRRRQELTPRDGLALGLAQVAALAPGVSRSGATLAVARARGFRRRDAHELSWHAGLPVIAGASALNIRQLAARRRAGRLAPALPLATLGAGALAAFCSTLACERLLRPTRWREAPLWPFSVYRLALAARTLSRRAA
jgi:undecaprenyl-diphosphatase